MTSHENKNRQIKDVVNGMQSFVTAFESLPEDRALYNRREKLQPPVTDTFGTHKERRHLLDGRARIQQEIDAGEGFTLMFSTVDKNGVRRVVGIGRTPDELNPSKGGKYDFTADTDGHGPKDYLMLVHNDSDESPPIARYLSAEQLQDVTVAPGDEDLTFNPTAYRTNPKHGIKTKVTGKVESVIVLE